MFKKVNHHILILTLILVLGSGFLKANNIATTSGAWETGTNWSLGVPPISTDIVTIPSGITMTVKVANDVCGSLSIAPTGSLIINAAGGLSIGGNFSNSGSFTSTTGSTLTFNGAATSVITGGGTYLIAGTVVLNMGLATATLDIQDANFIAGINSGGKYYVSFLKGTWKMNNAGSLNDCYNTGSTNALTIPFGVVIESDAGTMNLCRNAPSGNAVLSGKLLLNGGIVNIQTGQGFNSGQDFHYHVAGGTPQLYISAGSLNIGAGFNADAATDFIDFHMTGGVMIVALNGYSNWITFQLADVVGGKTVMSGGTIILQDACNANIEDLDMGGANVAATQYSVTGGTVQLGYTNTQNSASFFGINAEPTTNYPNIDFEAGVPKNVSAFTGGNINMLSLYVNTNMTFDATGFPNVNIMSNNGTFAFDDEGGFIQSTNTVTFSGPVPQLITSTSLANEIFYNLNISNTSGHVILGVATTVTNQLNFAAGVLDASNNSLTLSNGAVPVTGASATSYIITGNGVTSLGLLNISNVPVNTSTLFPVGTAAYYLPASINPGANTANSYSAFVFQGATTSATSNGPAFSAGSLAKILNAEWNIARTAGLGTAALTLNWSSSGTILEGSSFQGYGLNIGTSQYSAGSWQPGTGAGNVATQTATSSFNSFSQFMVVGSAIVLPIELLDFAAHVKNDNSVLLSWILSEGDNASEFEVERSPGGQDWKTIGKVYSKDNVSSGATYAFTDTDPATGVSYYRLLLHNQDASLSYSPVRAVTLSLMTGITVYPNPAYHIINVSVGNSGSDLTILLLGPSGQTLASSRTNQSGSSVNSLDVSHYPSGVYLIQIVSEKKTVSTSVVIVAH